MRKLNKLNEAMRDSERYYESDEYLNAFLEFVPETLQYNGNLSEEEQDRLSYEAELEVSYTYNYYQSDRDLVCCFPISEIHNTIDTDLTQRESMKL